jgi:hypothetical protein
MSHIVRSFKSKVFQFRNKISDLCRLAHFHFMARNLHLVKVRKGAWQAVVYKKSHFLFLFCFVSSLAFAPNLFAVTDGLKHCIAIIQQLDKEVASHTSSVKEALAKSRDIITNLKIDERATADVLARRLLSEMEKVDVKLLPGQITLLGHLASDDDISPAAWEKILEKLFSIVNFEKYREDLRELAATQLGNILLTKQARKMRIATKMVAQNENLIVRAPTIISAKITLGFAWVLSDRSVPRDLQQHFLEMLYEYRAEEISKNLINAENRDDPHLEEFNSQATAFEKAILIMKLALAKQPSLTFHVDEYSRGYLLVKDFFDTLERYKIETEKGVMRLKMLPSDSAEFAVIEKEISAWVENSRIFLQYVYEHYQINEMEPLMKIMADRREQTEGIIEDINGLIEQWHSESHVAGYFEDGMEAYLPEMQRLVEKLQKSLASDLRLSYLINDKEEEGARKKRFEAVFDLISRGRDPSEIPMDALVRIGRMTKLEDIQAALKKFETAGGEPVTITVAGNLPSMISRKVAVMMSRDKTDKERKSASALAVRLVADLRMTSRQLESSIHDHSLTAAEAFPLIKRQLRLKSIRDFIFLRLGEFDRYFKTDIDDFLQLRSQVDAIKTQLVFMGTNFGEAPLFEAVDTEATFAQRYELVRKLQAQGIDLKGLSIEELEHLGNIKDPTEFEGQLRKRFRAPAL